MDSKPRRLPFMPSSSSSSSSSSSPSSVSSPLGSSRLYSGRANVLSSERYSRGTPVKLESEYQSSRFHSSSRDYSFPESRHSSWKLSSPSLTPASTSYDRSWSDTSVGTRSKLLSHQGESERRQGTYCGLLSASQDTDSKRPKLSYTNRATYSRSASSSGVNSSYSGIGSISDSSWKYSPVSRSSSSSSSSESLRSRRELDKRAEASLSSYGDHSRRNGGLLSSSLYLQDRVTSSYAQGARPKESSFTSSRVNRSTSHHMTSDYERSLLYRDTCRNASRSSSSVSSKDQESPQPTVAPESRNASSRSCAWYIPLSERTTTTPPSPPQRQSTETSDSDGRRTTRQLLSRLACSMSSTFFSRRSSQDSSGSSSRSFESSTEEAYDVPRAENSSQSSDSRNSSPEVSERRATDSSQGFTFLRRRRQGLPPVLETRNTESVPETSRSASAENRSSGSWLSSSFRNRCTPLFSRRRREGRDETARMASSSDEMYGESQGLWSRRESCESKASGGDQDEESQGAGASASPAAAESSTPAHDASPAGRNPRLSGIVPNSLFRLAMPSTLESTLPDNVMITVDIMAAGRTQPDGQESGKSVPSRDPEKLKKIQESLLLEESDDEEGDLCRICQMGTETPSNPLIEPCRCTGSLQYVHQDCMKKWLRSKINSGSNLEAITTCELCKEKLHLNIENFDINELYRTHASERAEYEFISCGLYLVVLLHLCEQRFSDVLGAANDAGALMRNLKRRLKMTADHLLILMMTTMTMRRKRRNSIEQKSNWNNTTSLLL
ncbi:E3 ubiquitin-protein ligase MARCHF7 isoform X2 [Amia ocellicauda]|uniref:E3 ubiquitin-protein ligase MARCHF7 isoform X2 n=1 Tax=Amia ocellicauda TaxID=2972642 RepID=UPI0034646AA2